MIINIVRMIYKFQFFSILLNYLIYCYIDNRLFYILSGYKKTPLKIFTNDYYIYCKFENIKIFHCRHYKYFVTDVVINIL